MLQEPREIAKPADSTVPEKAVEIPARKISIKKLEAEV